MARDRRPSALRTAAGCLGGTFVVIAVLALGLGTVAYFALRDVDVGIGFDFDGLTVLPERVDSLSAFDPASNTRLWAREFRSATYVGATADVVMLQDDGGMFGVDLGTGADRWRAAPVSTSSDCPAVVVDGTVVGTGREDIVARDAATGALVWRVYFSGLDCTRLVAAPGAVLIEALNWWAAYRVADGAPLWSQPAPGAVLQGSFGGAVLAVSIADVRAVDAQTGAIRWIWQSSDPGETFIPEFTYRAAPAGETVGVGIRDPNDGSDDPRTGTVFLGADGVERWRTPSGLLSSFAYDDATGTLLELGEPPVLTGRDPTTGAELWRGVEGEGKIVAGGGVVVLGREGVRTFDARTGSLLGTLATHGEPLAISNGVVLVSG